MARAKPALERWLPRHAPGRRPAARGHVHWQAVELEEFDYDLPPWAIAQTPAESRDAARLLLIDRARRRFTDYVFADLPDLLRPGDSPAVDNPRGSAAPVL